MMLPSRSDEASLLRQIAAGDDAAFSAFYREPGALPAGGVIRIGAPAEPRESSFYAPRGGGIVKGTVHYRGGATCHLTARSWIGGKYACAPELKVPVGWVPARAPAPTAAQVASPMHVRLIPGRDGGYEAVLRFTSRVAIGNARSSYTVQWHETGQPPQVHTFARPTPAFPAVGQTEEMRLGRGLGRGRLRRGVITGEVLFQDQTGPGNLEEAGGTVQLTVGRFSLTVP
jgi:hypothetical protein